MTRNDSPVYLVYPPDPSGRRPNQYTQLQYANPAQRESFERFEAARMSRTGCDSYSNQIPGNTGLLSYNQTVPDRSAGQPTPTARRAEPTSIRRAGDNTASASSSGGSQRSRTQPTPTRYWYCCNPGCPSNGPYIERLYENCYNGCGHRRCLGCRRQIVSLIEEPPIEYASSRPRRH